MNSQGENIKIFTKPINIFFILQTHFFYPNKLDMEIWTSDLKEKKKLHTSITTKLYPHGQK